MKKVLKITGYAVVAILAVVAAGVVYLQFAYPKVNAAPVLTVEKDPHLIERGEYLANHVTVCIDCHSTRDWSSFSGPPVAGTFGKGGDKFDHSFGFPGTFYAKNITSDPETGIGNWTDGEIYRAITAGVNKNGEPLFPIMPYQSYKQMSQQDIHAIIAYIRTLAPVEHQVPESDPDFPFSLILRTIPSDEVATAEPVLDTEEAKGKYLTTIAGCGDCHTPRENNVPLEGKHLAGGMEFKLPNGAVLRSANISPDAETGIGNWTEDAFVSRFKMMLNDSAATAATVGPNEFNTLMPWKMYAGMQEEDLKAIYRYLKTVPSKKNKVMKYSPPTKS